MRECEIRVLQKVTQDYFGKSVEDRVSGMQRGRKAKPTCLTDSIFQSNCEFRAMDSAERRLHPVLDDMGLFFRGNTGNVQLQHDFMLFL